VSRTKRSKPFMLYISQKSAFMVDGLFHLNGVTPPEGFVHRAVPADEGAGGEEEGPQDG